MWIEDLQNLLLALTPQQRWSAARGSAGSAPLPFEPLLTGFAIVALIVSAILMLWVTLKRRRNERNFRANITDLTINTFKLRQERDRLRRERDQLGITNRELQKAITELSMKQAAVLEDMHSE